MAVDFIKHISGSYNKGGTVPKTEEFVDNDFLQYELSCFLRYRVSVMKDTKQKDKGYVLVEDLEVIRGRI